MVSMPGTPAVVFLYGARLYIEDCALLDFTTSGT
jgi:hypothetical protein